MFDPYSLKYLNNCSASRIVIPCLEAFLAVRFAVPPMPSQTFLPCDVAKKLYETNFNP